MPAISPPPPTGTKIADDVAELVPQDLVADRALPGDDQRIVERVRRTSRPVDRGELVAARLGVGVGVARAARPRRPCSRTASTLISGVVCGITMSARSPRWRAANATPCAWLPALAAMTPRARSAVGEVGDAVVGAAQLEAEDRLQVLALEQDLVAAGAAESRGAGSSGVSCATS